MSGIRLYLVHRIFIKNFREESIPGNYFYSLQFSNIRKGLDLFKKYVKNQEEVYRKWFYPDLEASSNFWLIFSVKGSVYRQYLPSSWHSFLFCCIFISIQLFVALRRSVRRDEQGNRVWTPDGNRRCMRTVSAIRWKSVTGILREGWQRREVS